MGIASSVAQERPAVFLPGRAGTVRWRSGGRGDLGVLEGVQEPVAGFFAEHVRGTRLDGGIVALAVGTGGDDDGNVGTDEVDLLNDGVAGDVVERACLEPAHLDDEGVAAFGPAAVDVDEVSAGEGGLRIGELLGAVMVPGCFRVGKETGGSPVRRSSGWRRWRPGPGDGGSLPREEGKARGIWVA